MSKVKMETIAIYLFTHAKQLRYGVVSASLRIHEGRVVSIYYETSECIKEREEVKE